MQEAITRLRGSQPKHISRNVWITTTGIFPIVQISSVSFHTCFGVSLTHNCRISSAFPYPVPWYLIPANIYLKSMLIWILVTSPTVQSFMNYRKSQGLPRLPAAFDIWQKNNHYLVQSVPETDYPCRIPSIVTGCGPILLPVTPVANEDPDLQSWLERASTVLINLGTHMRMNDTMAREFAAGLKIILDKKPDLQILWKLKTLGGLAMPSKSNSESGFQGEGIGKESLDAISREVSSDRVRIVEWLSVDPLAVLQTGLIVCSVHHGGSNSFHEALRYMQSVPVTSYANELQRRGAASRDSLLARHT